MTLESLKQRFVECEDIQFKIYPGFTEDKPWGIVIFDSAMCDSLLLSKTFYPALYKEWKKSQTDQQAPNPSELEAQLFLRKIPAIENKLVQMVFSGYAVLLLPNEQFCYAFEAAGDLNRKPEDAKTEASVKGARDGFVENLDTNIALIRKRLKTTDLVYQSFSLGEITPVNVAMLYLKERVIPETVTEIQNKLNSYKGDSPTGIGELIEHISPYKFSVLPIFDYSGRPDFVNDSLMRGRLILILDGSPVALIAPASFMQLLFSAEDPHLPFYFAFPWRVLRMIGVFLSVFLPGFYIAIMSYHQEQIPFPLLATVASTRLGLPFPIAVEMVTILFILSLLREAGNRMPTPVGGTITVVSGIIIGDAAIRGGIFSPTLTVVAAMSFVAGSALSNQDFVITQTIMRFFTLILSSVIGLFGFFIALFCIVMYMSNHQPFGQPFLAPFSPFSLQKLLRNFMRLPGLRKKGGSL
nr:spore germination protein [Paenibacillus castaneae]